MKRNDRWGSAQPSEGENALLRMDWRKQLENLDKHWVMHTPENEALWQNQKAVCWQCVYAACLQYRAEYTYDERAEAAILVMQELEKYDPAKYHLQEGGSSTSALVSYTLGLLRLKMRTAYAQGMDIEYDSPDQSGQNPHKGLIVTSLNETVGDDDDSEDNPTRGDLLQDPLVGRRDDPYAKDAAAAVIFSFLAQVANFDTYQKGQRRNDTRRLHYRLCLTEQLTCFAMQGGLRRVLESGSHYFKATDVQKALSKNYLTFFCQTVPNHILSLETIRLKRRCDCFSWDPTEQSREDLLTFKDSGFLEAKVPLSYLATCKNITSSNSDISRYRDEYINDTKRWVNKFGYDHTILYEIG